MIGVFVIKKRVLRFSVLFCFIISLFAISACDTGRDITELADLPQASQQSQSMMEQTDEEESVYSNVYTADDDDSAVTEDIVDDNVVPLSLEYDLGIRINDEWFPIRHDVRDLLAAIDGNYVLSTAPSCVFEGLDKEFDFGTVLVSTNPNHDASRDIWFSIFITCEDFPTARGIRVGSTLEDVKAAYGMRYFWEGHRVITYSISGVQGDISSPCIQFTIEDGVVTAIEIYYPTNV